MNKRAVWLGATALVIAAALVRVLAADETAPYPGEAQTVVGAVSYYIGYYGVFTAIAVAILLPIITAWNKRRAKG